MLAGYLQKRQLPLARLALETLLEIAPVHPRRAEYEAAVAGLTRESEGKRRGERLLAAARDALAGGDVRGARRELEALAKLDARRAEDPAASMTPPRPSATSAASPTSTSTAGGSTSTWPLAACVEAEGELDSLSSLELTRVGLDGLRARLDEVRSSAEEKTRIAEFERRYGVVRDHQDWFGAREVALEFERALPSHPRPPEMFAEVARLESEQRRQQAIEQGVRQVEAFVEKRDGAKAELALKVLLQLDPENRHRRRLEKQVKTVQRA